MNFVWYFIKMSFYASGKFMVMGAEAESVRGEGRQRGGSGSSVSILSELSSAGGVQSLPGGARVKADWLVGVGVMAAGIAMGGLWLWQEERGSTEAPMAQAIVIKQAVLQGLEGGLEDERPRVERRLNMESPVSVLSPSVSASVVMRGTNGSGLPVPSAVAEPESGQEVAPTDRRLPPAKATLMRDESRRASASKPGGLRVAKKQFSRRVVEGKKLPAKRREVGVAGASGAEAGLKRERARSERDVDIIMAIVR